MDYALINAGTVKNIIVAEADFIESIRADWQHIAPLAQGAGVGWGWDGTQFVAPVADITPRPEEAPSWAWLIDIGPFVDRFGNERYTVEQSSDPFVVSFCHDVDTRRKWIDLRDPRVAAALYYLAGHPLPGVGTIAAPILTPAKVATILTTPVAPAENLALRKLYFS